MVGRCEDRCRRFRVKPGRTGTITSGRMGAIKPGMTETIKFGMTGSIMFGKMRTIKPGMRGPIKPGMMGTITYGMRETIISGRRGTILPKRKGTTTPGRNPFVMADSDRPSGGKVAQEAENSSNKACPKGEAFGNLEGGGYVLGLLVHGDAGLGAGAADPDKEVRADLREIPGQARNVSSGGLGTRGSRGIRNDGSGGLSTRWVGGILKDGRSRGGGPLVMAGSDRPSLGRAGLGQG